MTEDNRAASEPAEPTTRLAAIIRPNGKTYQPRKISVAYCEEGACADASVIVFGTHDVVLAWPQAALDFARSVTWEAS